MRLGIFVFAALVSLSAARADEAPNCFIKITGQKDKLHFGTHLHSKAECQALARIHQRNADLDSSARKRVDYRWKGRKTTG